MDRRTDVAVSAAFVLFGVFVIVEATTIKTGLYLDPIGPRAFFYACGAIFVAGGLVNIAQRVVSWRASGPVVPSEGVDDEAGHPSSFRRAALVALASVLYALAFRPLGYLIATPIYIVALLWILRQRSLPRNLAVAVLFTAVFYLTFAKGLGVWLPVGPFTELFRDLGWVIL